MKTTNLFLLLALVFLSSAGLHAQVTIGGTENPKTGAILDLNSTAKGGLLLSNITIEDLEKIPATFGGVTIPESDRDENISLRGALVYHVGGNYILAGIYVWNGKIWMPAGSIEVIEEIKISGTWQVPTGCTSVDVFVVGGGGSAAGIDAGAGGGGYTAISYNIQVIPGEILTANVGDGGIATSSGNGSRGGTTSLQRGAITLIEAEGGYGGVASTASNGRHGGNGGSGGGAGCFLYDGVGGAGGSDGGDGGTSSTASLGGIGQGTSTRCPFNNILYAGGGGGSRWNNTALSPGGEGGGGSGGKIDTAAESGVPNTGGGGGAWSGNGGSGIIILHYFK
jgi:hypothetical protein